MTLTEHIALDVLRLLSGPVLARVLAQLHQERPNLLGDLLRELEVQIGLAPPNATVSTLVSLNSRIAKGYVALVNGAQRVVECRQRWRAADERAGTLFADLHAAQRDRQQAQADLGQAADELSTILSAGLTAPLAGAAEELRARNRFDCPTCGQGIGADEDWCCSTCGATVLVIEDGKPRPEWTGWDEVEDATCPQCKTGKLYALEEHRCCAVCGLLPDETAKS